MEDFLIVGITVSFLLCLLVFSKKNRSKADVIFGVWQIVLILHLVFLYVRYSGLHWEYPHLLALDTSFGLLHAPFIFLYIQVQLSDRSQGLVQYLLHALPFLLINVVLILTFYFLSAEQKLSLYRSALENPQMSITDHLLSLQGIIYLIWSTRLIRTYERRVKASFSSIRNVNIWWLRRLLILLGSVVGISLTVNILHQMNVVGLEILGMVNVIIFSFLLLVIGYYGIKKTTVFIKDESSDKTSGYQRSGLSSEEAENQMIKVKAFMEKESPYLQSDLSLGQLANLLDISSNHLSQVINQNTGKNFYEFINEYRTQEAMRRLSDENYNHYKVLAIAYDSGFNSKSVFNAFFKKATNSTPSAYRSQFMNKS